MSVNINIKYINTQGHDLTFNFKLPLCVEKSLFNYYKSLNEQLTSLPHSHLAVHDIGKVKGRQQVSHMKERLPIFFHDAMVAGHKWEQGVVPQLLETLHLVFRELLQDVALICCFEVT